MCYCARLLLYLVPGVRLPNSSVAEDHIAPSTMRVIATLQGLWMTACRLSVLSCCVVSREAGAPSYHGVRRCFYSYTRIVVCELHVTFCGPRHQSSQAQLER